MLLDEELTQAGDNESDTNKVTAWVLDKVNLWRDHRHANYDSHWELYENIWRGRTTNKKGTLAENFISPATQQAVESSVAEIEETVFGRGAPFDIKDDDPQVEDVAQMRSLLWEDLQKQKNGVRKAVSEALINSAVYGTGITELQVVKEDRKVPIQVPTQGGTPVVAANTSEYVCVKWRSIVPNNFLIDPNATCIADALGCAIEEYTGRHTILEAQKQGWYRDVEIPTGAPADSNLAKDRALTDTDNKDRVKILKYYGLVPRAYIEQFQNQDLDDGEYIELTTNNRKERMTQEEAEAELKKLEETAEVEEDVENDLVEAIVVIVNDSVCLKAEETPYIMEDRPVVAFPWDYVPGRFWGRGVCEKGFNAQAVLDTEIRNRLALMDYAANPMVGINATMVPRGFKFEIKRGKNVFMNGRPSEIMEKFTVADVDQNTWKNAEVMERMVYQSTGAADLSGIPGDINGEATAAGMSMAMSGVIKRTKRVILNFYDQYLMPAIQKTAWRYMQFDPNRYKANDYEFIPSSTMGIMAREYEQSQLASMLSNMQPGTPEHRAILYGIIENSSLHGRENVLAVLKQSEQPNPEAEQEAQKQKQMAEQAAMLELRRKNAEATLKEAEAQKVSTETALLPEELKIKYIGHLSRNADTNDELAQNLKIAELHLKHRDLEVKAADIISNERIAAMQTQSKESSDKLKALMDVIKLSRQEQEFVYDDNGNVTGTRNK